MSRFLQLHLLTFYPPSNVNRDDTGNPKTATVGGVTRLRISSQALKRAWRTSEIFSSALAGHMGQRTQRLGDEIRQHLLGKGVDEKKSIGIARAIAGIYGKVKAEKDDNACFTEQLVFISPAERDAALAMADRLAAGEKIDPVKEKDALLQRTDTAADIALFGRMLASELSYNREAAVQVAHAITTHRVTVEDDYYTAIDDLKRPEEDAGAGFLGEAGFGSGVFYLYLCVNRDLLRKNLGGDSEGGVMEAALGALASAAATVAPSGKQNSFAALARAQYILAEKGNAQPRTLAGAFARPVTGPDLMAGSIATLTEFRSELTRVYGRASDTEGELEVGRKDSMTLADIAAFCRS
ncbi:type I-E CRISPR-associated protein Cas7/Cse4/CasC [Gluconacetobacter azotocaptans]|uniref:Type I-E CRISPR-associated protein Cas7/Cse4/CasC n=1 Tax=Gluconacetobacter azotocaptans TaxID=142834 RepID=A0A7W4JPT4_9PROT|nr:type I-E CRISPR-associated protein Cas7/Cse4/CasC [Gluconacetobacter azotocaptans]MBB2188678.1 type I-E CRISPR-associated protein Cas7/Cse4/CasC [Gluconacetobacter azotocaptans]GBQ35125.1 CRISPR-associated protein Cse4 [Gluconacetobacter azotocaptans DSM 13594]